MTGSIRGASAFEGFVLEQPDVATATKRPNRIVAFVTVTLRFDARLITFTVSVQSETALSDGPMVLGWRFAEN